MRPHGEHNQLPKPGQIIEPPVNFPVRWEHPDDQRMFWTTDIYHYPQPMAPLEFELTNAIYEEGGNRALSQFNVPFRMSARRINGYFYRSAAAEGAPPDGVAKIMNQVRRFAPGLIKSIEAKAVASMGAKYLPTMDELVDQMEAWWGEQLLPEVKGYLAEWDTFDLENSSLPALRDHLERVLASQ